jgi:hypothetical protein
MKTVSTIKVGYHTYMIPESMGSKEVQALVGMLSTLREVDSQFSKTTNDFKTFQFLKGYPAVQLGTAPVWPNQDAAEAERDKYDNSMADTASA